MARNSGGNRGDVRQSALWGSGNRGGELRSNALWGKGGRGIVVLMLLALSMPLAASAGVSKSNGNGNGAEGAKVQQSVLDSAKNTPGKKIRVIIQANEGLGAAKNAAAGLGQLKHELGLIGAVAVELPAGRIDALAKRSGLTITMDEPTKLLGHYSNTQLWAHEAGLNKLWEGPQAPTIAIVDSGIDGGRTDFAGRVLEQVNFVSSGNPNAAGDGRGHGTFVAGIAAGAAPGYAGAAPNAKLVSLDVMDDSGSGLTSDVIKASEWVLANKAKYNIRVANFSLHSANVNRFYDDPLNQAVSKLWFGGIVVVAASGNYGKPDGPSGVMHAPGNNPFVLTVGAVDIGGTAKPRDDAQAPWSAYGRTPDGFWKPEVCAPGRYMVGPIPDGSSLALAKAENKKGAGYIELSGTSFAAPVVSGIAAQILARNPGFTPDQVKGAIMESVRDVPQGAPNACGVGQVNAVRGGLSAKAANPNAALNAFVTTNLLTGQQVFDAVSWSNVSWSNVSWSNVSWSNYSSEDNAEGETNTDVPYVLTPEEAADVALDPDLLAPGETLPEPVTAPVATAVPGEPTP